MTTTDTDALTERIARAIHLDDLSAGEAEPWGVNAHLMAWYRRNAAAVLPIVSEEVRKASEKAWDDCAHEADRRWLIGGQSAAILHDRNPYRETGDGTSPHASRIRRLIGSPTTGCGRGPCCLGDGHDGDCRL